MIISFWIGDVSQELLFCNEWPKAIPIRIFHDSDVIEIIRELNPVWEELYNSILIPSCKSDIARLVLLYKYGGLYLDMHSGNNNDEKAIFNLINYVTNYGFELVVFLSKNEIRIQRLNLLNGALAGRPGSDILLMLMYKAFENLKIHRDREKSNNQYSFFSYNIVALTGGWMIATSIFDVGNFEHRFNESGAEHYFGLLPKYRKRIKIELADLQTGHDAFIWYKNYQYHEIDDHWSEKQKTTRLLMPWVY